MFQDEGFELPVTNFMNRIGEALDKDQFCQIIEDIKKTIQGEKDDFCKANYKSIKEAKQNYWLFSLRS